jgi:hypothetical protein
MRIRNREVQDTMAATLERFAHVIVRPRLLRETSARRSAA